MSYTNISVSWQCYAEIKLFYWMLQGYTPSFTDFAKLRPLWASFTDGYGFFGPNRQSKKTNSQIYSTESQASFTDKEFFCFGNGI